MFFEINHISKPYVIGNNYFIMLIVDMNVILLKFYYLHFGYKYLVTYICKNAVDESETETVRTYHVKK